MSVTDRDEQQARLAALKAGEAELTDGPDAALAALGPPTDPIRMRATLGILIRAGRHKVAADLIRDQRVDDKWIDLAALTFALDGDIARARALVDRADNSPDLPTVRSSRLGFAEGIVERWHARRPVISFLSANEWPATDVELAKTVIDLLEPLLSSVRANRRIGGDTELSAVINALYCARIANDPRVLSECSSWLIRHVPVPLIVAELCLRGIVPTTPEGLPSRLRIEHQGAFQASILAAVLERDIFRQPQRALDAFIELSTRQLNEHEKESVCTALAETCGQCGAEQIQRSIDVVTRLRPDDARSLGYMRVIKLATEGNLTDATSELEALRDETDGVWWQVRAQFYEKAGDDDAAQRAWERASALLPHPDVVRRSIRASLDRRRYESAARELRKALEHEPGNVQHLKNLAWTLVQLNDQAAAATVLRKLLDIDPNNDEYRIALSQSLGRTARVHEAIEILGPVCNKDAPPLDAILLQCEFLEADNKAGEAFKLLDAIAADHWDEPRFLVGYVHYGHAAGEDQLAGEAFTRLLELRQEGKVPPEMLQAGTLEQIIEIGKDYRNRGETLRQMMVAGRMPWLFAEHALGNPPVWAWTLHTQRLPWVSEEPQTRAAFSVYASNGFTIHDRDGTKSLEPIAVPSQGTHVVADLSALLTLHFLGRLEHAADYFGCLLLPSSYGELRLRDASKFGQHQPSRETELRTLRNAIERRRLNIVADDAVGMFRVDEYVTDSPDHVFRLQDFIPALMKTQRVSPTDLENLKRVAHKPAAADAVHAGFKLGDKIEVDLYTLRTLANQTVFEPILESFSINIRESQHKTLVSELQAYESAHEAKNAHDALWQTISALASTGKVQWKPVPPETAEDGDSDDDKRDPLVYFDATRLAHHLKVPLFADDRVLQVLAFQADPSSLATAFGTDIFLEAVLAQPGADRSAIAGDIRKFMGWRYRFLTPPDEILYVWAQESRDNLPGPALLEAASYLHDCLRDPGLHCGLEESDPPMPMAAKFVTAWMTAAASLLIRSWDDSTFTDAQCTRLTRWVGEELIPSCPWGLWLHETGERIARTVRTAPFIMAVGQSAGVANKERANRGLQVLASALQFTEDDYLAETATAIRMATQHLNVAAQEAERVDAFAKTMLQIALLHYRNRGLDPISTSRFKALGFFPAFTPPPLPNNLAMTLEVVEDEPAGVRGPLLFVQGDNEAHVLPIDAVLVRPENDLRRAALDVIEAADTGTDPWLTPATLDLIRQHADDIRSDSEARWRSAANDVAEAVRDDFFADIAAFRQSVSANYQAGANEYFGKLIHPQLQALLPVRPPLWSPSEQQKEIGSGVEELAHRPKIEEALTLYYHQFGYVPLFGDLSTPGLVRRWIDAHPGAALSWDNIWTWATSIDTPIARYHAVTIALAIPALRPAPLDVLWTQVALILDVTTREGHSPESSREWHLYCELASHFLRHIEALHPGQHGERSACYAWWLAAKIGRLVGRSTERIEHFLDKVLAPQARISHFRWVVSRSPVVPSSLRFATLHLRSIWAMSLLAHIGSSVRSFPDPRVPEQVKVIIEAVLHGYLVTGAIANEHDVANPLFAYQDISHLDELCTQAGYLPEAARVTLEELLMIRRYLASPKNLQACLEEWNDIAPHVQHLTMLSLLDATSSGSQCDELLSNWLEKTAQSVEVLLSSPPHVLDPLLELLAEFQQHSVANWATRLPHFLVYAIERSTDPQTIRILSAQVLHMSHNCGVASAFHRLLSSNKWKDWQSPVETWRENLLDVATWSEPWLMARIRASSTMASHWIGPPRKNGDSADSPHGDEVK